MNIWKQVKKLVNLRWNEVSGVDHSANEEEGWAVMKSASTPRVQVCGERHPGGSDCPTCDRITKQLGLETNDSKPIDEARVNKSAGGDHSPEEGDTMTNDEEFERFRKSVEQTLEALPDDDARQRYLEQLNEQAGKITKTRDLMSRMLKVLDKTDATGRLLELVQKAAGDAELVKDLKDMDSPDAPAGVDDEPSIPKGTVWREMRDVVAQAVVNVTKANVKQVAPLGVQEARAREVYAEIARESGDIPTSLTKGAARDMALALVANLEKYKAWMLANTPAAEKADCARRLDAMIQGYRDWAAREKA